MKFVLFQLAVVTAASAAAAPWLHGLCRPVLQGTAALALLPLWRLRSTPVFMPLFLGCFFLLTVSAWQLDRELRPDSVSSGILPRAENLEGIVEGAPLIEKRGKRVQAVFKLRVQSRVYFRGESLIRQRVSDKVQVQLLSPMRLPGRGDRVRVSGMLQKPSPQRNPFGYDEAARFSERGLDAKIKASGAKSLVILEKKRSGGISWAALDGLRAALEKKIESLWPERESAYFKALMIGIKGRIPEPERQAFIRTSTAHVLSISGLHFTLIAGTFFLLLTAAGVRYKAAAFVSLFFIGAYAVIAGADIPVVRAGAMAALALTGVLLDREAQALPIVSLVFCAFLWTDTRFAESVSFQLSFIAVFCLIVFCGRSSSASPLPSETWCTSILSCAAVTAGTLPVVAGVFHGLSLSAIPANLAAVPFFNAAILAGFGAVVLEAVPLIGHFAAAAAQQLLRAALWIVMTLSAVPGSYLPAAHPSGFQTTVYGILGILAAGLKLSGNPRAAVWRRAAYAGLVITGLSFFFSGSRPEVPVLTLMDSRAYPLSAVSFSAGRDWLIFRSGKRFEREALWVLEPYFSGAGIRRIEGAFDFSKKDSEIKTALVPGPLSRLRPERIWGVCGEGSCGKPDRIGPGGRIRLGPGQGSLQFLGAAGGEPILLISVGTAEFLFLPKVNREAADLLRRLEPWLSGVEVLVLPAVSQRTSAAWLSEILKAADPSLTVTAGGAPPESRQNSRWLSQRQLGALTFECQPRRLQVRSHADPGFSRTVFTGPIP